MQKKINKLINLMSEIKINRKRNEAIEIIDELVKLINNQDDQILGLSAWKTDNKREDIECELEKYILILIKYGFTQKLISNIRPETLRFIAKYKDKFIELKPEEFKTTDLWLMNFEMDKGYFPKTFDEFKKFYNEARS